MSNETSLAKLSKGAVAGIVGTVVLGAMMSFDKKYAAATVPKAKQDPGEFILDAIEEKAGLKGRVPKRVESAIAGGSVFGYGGTLGTLYGLWRNGSGDTTAGPLADGIVLGLLTYAIGSLGWLPLSGLTSPPWEQPLPEVAGDLLRHVVFGVATAACFDIFDDWI